MSETSIVTEQVEEELARLRRRVEQLEAELRDTRFVQTLVRSLDIHFHLPMFWKDRDLSYRWANEAYARSIGHRREEISGRKDAELLPSDESELRREEETRILQSGQASSVTVRRVINGVTSAFELFRIPVVDDKQTVLGLIGIERDITEQAAVIAELEQDRLLLEVLMDTLPDSIYFKDIENRFVRINRSTAAKFGIPHPKDAIGKTDFDIFSAEHASEAFEDEKRILETDQPVIAKEEKETWPNGRVSWVSTTKVPVHGSDQRLLGTFGVTRDITVRKQAQMALEASERRYRELIENANDIIYTHDLKGQMLSLNRAVEIASGYTMDDIDHLNVRDLVAPEHLPHALDMTRKKLEGIPTTTYELDIIGKDGRRIPLEVSTQILYEDGKAVAVQGIGRDITERKRAHEALRHQAQLLAEQAHQLEERNRDLSKAYRDLQDAESQLIHSEKMAAIGQLVAGLAHEINNPAAFVLTNLTTIGRDIDDILAYAKVCEDAADSLIRTDKSVATLLQSAREEHGVTDAIKEIGQLLDSCRSGMHRVRDLVANLRSYSRIDTRGSFDIADLAQGIEATLVLLRPMVPKSVSVEVLPSNAPAVECNLGQINQVFMNLIANSIQAVENSGRIEISIERGDDGVTVRIVDNGPGIAPEIRSRIFDPFFTTKDVGKGTGLGLTICQKIIDAHHGRIECDSIPGNGTQFRVWLPLRQPDRRVIQTIDAADNI